MCDGGARAGGLYAEYTKKKEKIREKKKDREEKETGRGCACEVNEKNSCFEARV